MCINLAGVQCIIVDVNAGSGYFVPDMSNELSELTGTITLRNKHVQEMLHQVVQNLWL